MKVYEKFYFDLDHILLHPLFKVEEKRNELLTARESKDTLSSPSTPLGCSFLSRALKVIDYGQSPEHGAYPRDLNAG